MEYDEIEFEFLQRFHFIFSLYNCFIKLSGNKLHFLERVTAICEGDDIKYITGSAEKPETTRRKRIIEYLGKIKPHPRKRVLSNAGENKSSQKERTKSKVKFENINLNDTENPLQVAELTPEPKNYPFLDQNDFDEVVQHLEV